MKIKKNCLRCGLEFEADGRKTLYCSRQCQSLAYRKKIGIKGAGLPTGTTGAIGELKVAIDLLSRGYEVFRAVTPNCSCDLAILKNGRLLRIEVRTAYLNNLTGKIAHNIPKSGRYDIYAAVLPDRIIYEPDLPQ